VAITARPRPIQARRLVRASPAELVAFLEDLDQHWQLTDGVVERLGPSDGGARVRIRGPLGLRRVATTRIDTATPAALTGTAQVGARTRARVSWRLRPVSGGTAVVLGVEVLSASWADRIVLALGARAWLAASLAGALERLDELALAGVLAGEVAA
jgi:hypothetical protein